ncbi:MAG: 2OG-Fe(II) oxygenase [Pseudomonadota bacterium]
MTQDIDRIVNRDAHPLNDINYRTRCKAALDRDGVLVLPAFLTQEGIASIQRDGEQNRHLAYYTANTHNIYLKPKDPELPDEHPRNREVDSSKGCITTDQIPASSALHALYEAKIFRNFLCAVLGEDALFEYADPLSSINVHYASEGQELGWHFDNSSFAITLLVQKPLDGGEFEYVKDVRDANAGEMNYARAAEILDGDIAPQQLSMDAGTLVLFRGRNSMHRVTPTVGDITRMLVVLAYNTEPGVSLSESARMTFYGRLD